MSRLGNYIYIFIVKLFVITKIQTDYCFKKYEISILIFKNYIKSFLVLNDFNYMQILKKQQGDIQSKQKSKPYSSKYINIVLCKLIVNCYLLLMTSTDTYVCCAYYSYECGLF